MGQICYGRGPTLAKPLDFWLDAFLSTIRGRLVTIPMLFVINSENAAMYRPLSSL